MISSISKLSQVPHQSDLPKPLLIACLNSYLLIQHFSSFCVDSWFCWESPSDMKGSIPSIFFVSSFELLNHPQVLNSVARNSIFYHVKYEMIAALLLLLLNSTQPTADHYPNMHYECLDEADPFPLFRFLLSYREVDELFRISIILGANGIAFCPNWQAAFASLNFSSLGPLLSLFLRPPTEQQLLLVDSTAPGVFHEVVALFYQTLLRHDEAIESLKNGRECIVALLYPLQLFNEKGTLCYFHSLVLSSLVLLTSDPRISASLNEPFTAAFPCRQSVHRGSHADLLLEIITNTAGADFTKTSPLLPAVACIFHNIAAHIRSFSYFTCNRIFRFLQLLTESHDRMAPQLGQIVVDGFNQILAEEFDKNVTILIFIVRNMRTFAALKQKGVNTDYISGFVKCFKAKARALSMGKMGTDEAEMVLKQMKSSMFMEDYELPGSRSHIFTGEMCELWPDWMRTLAMRAGGFKTLQ